MSKELKKTIKDNAIIYENDEAKIVFSKNSRPDTTEKYYCMSGVSKEKQGESFFNVPVMMVWGEQKFLELVEDLMKMKV